MLLKKSKSMLSMRVGGVHHTLNRVVQKRLNICASAVKKTGSKTVNIDGSIIKKIEKKYVSMCANIAKNTKKQSLYGINNIMMPIRIKSLKR